MFKGSLLSQDIDIVALFSADVLAAAVEYDAGLSRVLSFELLVNDARLANSSLKFLDDKFKFDIEAVAVDVVGVVELHVNCVMMFWNDD